VFERVAPVISVRDLDAALERYRRLGFRVREYDGDARYGFANRDGVELHLSESADASEAVVYLFVEDAAAVFAEWTAAGLGGLVPPVDTPWGRHEFAYRDPDGTVLRVGSAARGQGER